MGHLHKQRAVLAASIEAVEGTAETLAAGDGILALGAEFKRNIEMVPNDPLRPTFSQLARIPGKRTASISTSVQGKGSGTAGTPPEFDALIRACGFGVTNVAVTSDTYDFVSTGFESITMAHYEDGMRHQIAGARGNFAIGGAVGELLIFNFDMQGVEDSVTDTALITPTYQTAVPQPLLSTTFTLFGATVIGSSFSIDCGNVVTPRQDFTRASGHISVAYGNRVPVGNFVFEKELVAVADWYGRLVAGTEGIFQLVLGATGGNIITVNCPNTQIVDITEQDDGGKAMLSVDVAFNLSTGDDEFSIVFT